MQAIQKKPLNGYLLSFILCFATAVCLFLPFFIVDKGFFLYCGDFNSQQIPFYTYCQDFIQSGGGSFSWATDLGSGLVPSYSFYLLGSPTFWLSLLFPTSLIPYLMVPFLCLKFALAGVGVFAYASRYLKSRNYSILAAVLYTFSGFSLYNIFFNHFIEPIMLFPFLLWAMDAFFYDKKRGLFAIFVALNLLNSFFFFSGQVVFCVIYFIIKIISRDWKFSIKEFLLFVFEGVIGVLIGCVLFIPTAVQLLQNPRITNITDGEGMLMYGRVSQYFAILSSVFLPPDPPYIPNLFEDATVKWTSLSAYLPLVSFSGVICYFKAFKKTAFSRIMMICFIMAFVPILNSAFYCFNSSYYARWFYMPLLIMAMCTAFALRNASLEQIKSATLTTFIITCVYFVFGLVPDKIFDADLNKDVWQMGISEEPAKLFLTVITAILGLVAFYIVIRNFKKSPKGVAVLIGCVMAFSVFYGVLHISLGKFPQWENDQNYRQQTYVEKDELLQMLKGDEFFRIDTFECYENMGLHLNKPCIQFFNSTVNPSILEFYPSVDVKRDVSSKPPYDKYSLRGLLSVKYLIMPSDKTEQYFAENGGDGFKAIGDTTSYTVFENENFVPMGFAYDYYITKKDAESIPKTILSNILVRAVLLDEEQVQKYSGGLTHLPESMHTSYSYSSYINDCDQRRKMAVSDFNANNNGFTAEITLPKDNLVFFSVPYDEGFTATVNGEKAQVEKVSNGLTAVACKQGENKIEVVYSPKGYKIGVAATALGVAMLAGYILLNKKILPMQKRKEEI